jgi:hypothetical protein
MILTKTKIILLNSITQLGWIMEIPWIFCEVGTERLKAVYMDVRLEKI